MRRQASADAHFRTTTGGGVKPPQLYRRQAYDEFTAVAPIDSFNASFRVRYQRDPKLDLSVPIAVSEHYWRDGKPGDALLPCDRIARGRSTGRCRPLMTLPEGASERLDAVLEDPVFAFFKRLALRG